jgi:poly(glycerol-phosphate) alpha-glucosyltransferase
MAAANQETRIVHDESSLCGRAAALTKARNMVWTYTAHSSFIKNPRQLNGPLSEFHLDMCNHRDKFAGIVFTTRGEKNDFGKRFGFSNNLYEIPHPYPGAVVKKPFEERNGEKIVIVTRIEPVKRLNLAIDIFKAVSEALPGVFLEIYGIGAGFTDITEELKKQIETLKLTDKLFFKGFTERTDEVFSGAALSMMTSEQEGFGLTLIESISNGCPAFAFDVKYGPASIIDNGKTGYLIPDNDKSAYAKKMVAFLKDRELRQKMSENCYNDAERFSGENFLRKWADFLTAMEGKV